MHDEVVEITVTGLPPLARVTLQLSAELNGTPYSSAADFYADLQGRVDLTTDAPVAGSYQGVDAMGLFWSMVSAPDARDDPLGSTGDPWDLPPPQPYELLAMVDGEEVASASLERILVQEGVTARRLAEGRLRGALFIPPGPGPHPAMIVVSGSGGGYSQSIAASLASRGFAALGLAYFNAPDLPDQMIEVPLEYFEEGLDWLAAQPEVDGNRIGITGGSRGGELSLLLGSMIPRFRVVVSRVPAHVSWEACCDETALGKAAWTWGGEPIPFMPNSPVSMMASLYWDALQADYLGYFWLSLADQEAETAAAIPVERIDGPVLLISGGDDRLWPSAYMADRVMDRLKAHDFQHPFTHLRYDDAGHAFLTPYWPTARLVSILHPVVQEEMLLGGTPASLAYAAEDSWEKTVEFLETYLRQRLSRTGH
jgi:dienelactone hydrolase